MGGSLQRDRLTEEKELVQGQTPLDTGSADLGEGGLERPESASWRPASSALRRWHHRTQQGRHLRVHMPTMHSVLPKWLALGDPGGEKAGLLASGEGPRGSWDS